MKPGTGVWKALRGCDGCSSASLPRWRAQDYPSRAITVIVPFPPGGASDVVARIVTNQMSRILGQSIIIENVSGAGGTVGSARVAAAAPDGYTLLAGGDGLACRGSRCSRRISNTIPSPTSCRSASPPIPRQSLSRGRIFRHRT